MSDKSKEETNAERFAKLAGQILDTMEGLMTRNDPPSDRAQRMVAYSSVLVDIKHLTEG